MLCVDHGTGSQRGGIVLSVVRRFHCLGATIGPPRFTRYSAALPTQCSDGRAGPRLPAADRAGRRGGPPRRRPMLRSAPRGRILCSSRAAGLLPSAAVDRVPRTERPHRTARPTSRSRMHLNLQLFRQSEMIAQSGDPLINGSGTQKRRSGGFRAPRNPHFCVCGSAAASSRSPPGVDPAWIAHPAARHLKIAAGMDRAPDPSRPPQDRRPGWTAHPIRPGHLKIAGQVGSRTRSAPSAFPFVHIGRSEGAAGNLQAGVRSDQLTG
jgi:hypothetical protein